MPVYALAISVYVLALLYVGARKAKNVKSQEDFALAGRNLPTFVLVGTLLATWIGTGSIFGNAEETYRVGVAAFILPLAGVLGIFVLALLAARVRRAGQMTVQDLLEIRYGVTARILGTITLLISYTIIVSYQYRAGAAVLERFLPIEMGGFVNIHIFSIIAVAFVVILYTALAGMFSVAHTDLANGILMTIGIFVTLPILYFKVGAVDGLIAGLSSRHKEFFGPYTFTDYVGILLPSFLLLLGDANMYSRFFSATDAASARRSACWLLVGVALLETAIIALALIGSVLHPNLENAGHIIVEIAFHSLPVFLGPLLIATIVAVIVSTADSYLLAPSSALVRDVYHRFLKPDATGRELVRASRLVVVALGLIALALAFTSDNFFRVALFAYTIYGVGITPSLIGAFLWKRGNSCGAVASILIGVTTALAWHIAGLDSSGVRVLGLDIPPLDAVIPAFILSIVTLVVVSLLTRPPKTESLELFIPLSQLDNY